jgi:hypothetical protein
VVRVYICPVIGSGTKLDPYRSKAQDFGYQYASFMRSNPDGSSAIAWTLTVAASQDFTAIDADATCDDVFAGDLPANVNTRPELLAFLRRPDRGRHSRGEAVGGAGRARQVPGGSHRFRVDDAAVAADAEDRVDVVRHDRRRGR